MCTLPNEKGILASTFCFMYVGCLQYVGISFSSCLLLCLTDALLFSPWIFPETETACDCSWLGILIERICQASIPSVRGSWPLCLQSEERAFHCYVFYWNKQLQNQSGPKSHIWFLVLSVTVLWSFASKNPNDCFYSLDITACAFIEFLLDSILRMSNESLLQAKPSQ